MTTGSEWIKKQRYVSDVSPLAASAADLLGIVFGGISHLDEKALRKADWENPHYFEIVISGSLSTWDGPTLTWLVVMAHDAMLRLEIEGAGKNRLCLRFHRREERWEPGVNSLIISIPTMETHLAHIRKYYPLG